MSYPWEDDVEFCNYMALLERRNPGSPSTNVVRRVLWWKLKQEDGLWGFPDDPLHPEGWTKP